MADPVGSVSLAIQITSWIIDYGSCIRNEDEERLGLVRDLGTTLGLLYGLRNMQDLPVLQDQVRQGLSKLEGANGVLADYIQTLRNLSHSVEVSSSRHRTIQKITWHFEKKGSIAALERAKRLQDLLLFAIQMDHVVLSEGIATYMRKIGDDIESIKHIATTVQKEQELLKVLTLDVRDGINSINEARAEVDLQAVADWITADDHWKQHTDLSRHCSGNTGAWFIESVEFQQWQTGMRRSLRCPGGPGVGKTMMATKAIKHLHDTEPEDVPVMFLYCNYKMQHQQTVAHLLELLLRQIILRTGFIPHQLQRLYEKGKQSRSSISITVVESLIGSCIASRPRAFIVIDALDECSASARSCLLGVIHRLQGESQLRVLSTSQRIDAIEMSVKPDVVKPIRASEHDLETHINENVAELPLCVERDPELLKIVTNTVVAAADGVFLLANLHLDSLKGLISKSAVHSALQAFPSGQDAWRKAYDMKMQRVSSQSRDRAWVAMKTLSWILKAKRPLSILEVQHAIATKPSQALPHADEIVDSEDILSVCAGLVIADRSTKSLRFVHATLQSSLLCTQSVWFPNMDSTIAHSCIDYLIHPDVAAANPEGNGTRRDSSAKSRHRITAMERFLSSDDSFGPSPHMCPSFDFASSTSKYPFLRYAAQYWGAHVRDAERNEGFLEQLMSKVVHSVGTNQFRSAKILGPAGRLALPESLRFDGLLPRTMMCYAASFGLQSLAEHSLNHEQQANRDNIRLVRPMIIASKLGHCEIVEILLNDGRLKPDDILDAVGKQTALHYSAYEGHEQVVRLLLARGATTFVLSAAEDTPLGLAIMQGHKAAVEALLLEGTHDTREKHFLSTAVMKAVGRGDVEVLQLLIERDRANLSYRDISGRTALATAAAYGRAGVVDLLLSYCTESIEWEDVQEDDGTSENGAFDQTVCVDQAVDVNIPDCNGQSALSLAAEKGHESIVRALLKAHLTDVNLLDCNKRSALSHAAKNGHEPIARALLKVPGIDYDIKDDAGLTPLAWACYAKASNRCYPEIMKLLLATGKVDPDSVDNYGSTPLECAVYHSNTEAVKHLLATGNVDVNRENECGITPFVQALSQSEIITEMILATGNVKFAPIDSCSLMPSQQRALWKIVKANPSSPTFQKVADMLPIIIEEREKRRAIRTKFLENARAKGNLNFEHLAEGL